MKNPAQYLVAASATTLDVLAALLAANYLTGLSATELARATGLSLPNITRHVATLEARGFAERLPETGRIRASHGLARHAVRILASLDASQRRIEATRQTLTQA